MPTGSQDVQARLMGYFFFPPHPQSEVLGCRTAATRRRLEVNRRRLMVNRRRSAGNPQQLLTSRQGSIGMAVHRRRRRGGYPPLDPPPPDQSDHRGKKRNLPLGKCGRAIFGTQKNLGPRIPPPPPHPPSVTSLPTSALLRPSCQSSPVLLGGRGARTALRARLAET